MTADVSLLLPPGVLDDALNVYGQIQRRRVEALFNLHRAVFAESLVATLLSGAVLSADPAHEYDLTWQRNGDDIKTEVKCSGEYLPRYGIEYRSPLSWTFPIQKRLWDGSSRKHVPSASYHFDVLVLARHLGNALGAGWTFHVLNALEALEMGGSATGRSLTGFPAVTPSELATSVADAHRRLRSAGSTAL